VILPEPLAEAQRARAPVAGRLDLLLAHDGVITRARRAFASPPLQLSRLRYDDPADPGAAVLTLLHLGGVLAGDRVQMRVEVGPGAAAQIPMAAATQVLRMPEGDAAHTLEIVLAERSRLAWLAQPLILFAGARFSQSTHITLAAGAQLALLDVLAPGRLARGERWQFARYESRLEVCDPGGRLLVAERAVIEPARSIPFVPDHAPVAGSLYLLGDTVDAERLASELHAAAPPGMGATVLPNGAGLLVRALGPTPSEVHRALSRIIYARWHATQQNASGDHST
jgi:urease accessory protein